MKTLDKIQTWLNGKKIPGARSSTPTNASNAEGNGHDKTLPRSARRRLFTRTNSAAPKPSQSTSATPQFARPEKKHHPSTRDTVLDNASPIMTILKDGSEALKDIPYIKAIAGVTFTILSIRKEIKDVDERTSELLGTAQRRSENLIQTLDDLARNAGGRLEQVERHLEDYEKFLKSIEVDMNEIKKAGSARRWLERADCRDRIESHIRRMDEFDRIFTTSALSKILGLLLEKDKQPLSNPEITEHLFKDGQPVAPALVLGREDELKAMKTIFLHNTAPRLAILGPGGMGKTTMAQHLMSDVDVLKLFPTPLFVSCENITSSISILHSVADVLHIPTAQRGQALQTNVVEQLRSRSGGLLCLDNFEDAWDPPSTRRTIEDLLTLLDGIRSIGIIVTMRGTEKPRGLSWTYPQPAHLQPLQDEPALALFKAVSHCSHDSTSTLLAAVDNVPLAIMLLGRLVEEEGFDYVLQQWQMEGLSVVDRGDASDTRTTSVTASINLSLNSPRISSISFIHEVLAMLGILPDGLSDSMISALQANLPPGVDLRRVLQALKRIALCYIDSNGRYRLLAPIRQHVQKALLLDPGFLSGARSTFLQHAISRDNSSDHDVAVPELANIRHFVASESTTWDETRILACLSCVLWEDRILGTRDISLALNALAHADTAVLQLRCRLCISTLLLSSSQPRQARVHLFPALSIETGGPYWQGRIRLEMGDIERMLSRYDEAKAFLHQAASFFKEANRPEMEGIVLERLGTLLRDLGRTSEAEEPLIRSLELAKNAGGIIMEGNALLSLGEGYQLTHQLSKAEDCLRQALDCYQRSHSAFGEAVAFQSLGVVQYDKGDLEESERSLLNARDLFVRIRDSAGQASALRWLALVYTHTDAPVDLVESHFMNALAINKQIDSQDGQAYILEDMGDFYSQQGQLSKAIDCWVISIVFHLRRLHQSKWEHVVPICAAIQKAVQNGLSSTG